MLVGDGGSHTLATLDAFGVVGYPRRAALKAMTVSVLITDEAAAAGLLER